MTVQERSSASGAAGSSTQATVTDASVPAFPETADIDTSSDDYARRFSGKIGAWFLEVQEAATMRMLAPSRETTILDVGGGHGQVARGLIESGYQLTVHGSSDKCRSRIRRFVEQGRCSFKVGDILNLPFPDRAFDTVLTYRLLAHVQCWRPFLSELARVAEHAVILDFASKRSLNYFSGRLFGLKKRLEGNTRPFACFAESELVRVFAELGFVPAKRYAEFLLPMVLHRALNLPLVSAGVEGALRISGLTYLFGSPVILKFVREGQ